VVTDDEQIAEALREHRNYGQRVKNLHHSIGWNSRLDTIQAAVLQVKLTHLERWNELRRRHAEAYFQGLVGLELGLPMEARGNRHVYHLFVVRTPRRDALNDHLAARGVSCGLHYPVPVHLQDAYRHLGYEEGAFPNAEAVARECLSLPMYPELTAAQIDHVCGAVREFFT
jgi:dTDP-4-amino-4,6-dideoxygalactose transaminase